jgi:ParB family chromosome partitioning protein
LSVRDAEQRAQQLLHPPAPRSEARADPDVLRLAEEVSEKVGAKVSIRPGRKGSGKLVVEYATLDQLDNLIAALSGRQ